MALPEGPPPPGGSSPPCRRRRPNSSFSLRLKLRHSSSRSGGPWLPPPGPCGPREPPRPQLGSFNDMESRSVRLQWVSFGGASAACRCPISGKFGNGSAQSIQSCAGARAHENAGNPTILIALDRRIELRCIDLVPHQELGRVARRYLGE